jgi:ornithine cyclodeaminase/alanine dehydrogenase-like protein (mu-crystallin family)
VGCGTQGRAQLRAVSRVRALRHAWVSDADPAAAERLAAELAGELGIPVTAERDHRMAVRRSAICVTCTPSRAYLLERADVAPGAFVAGVGADSEDKRELAPDLLAAATVVTDVLDQCAVIGDLHHALEAGRVTRAHVHADLGEIVAGRKPGRRREDEIVVFDSTGMALQDAAAAVLVYQRALAAGHRTAFDFTAEAGA